MITKKEIVEKRKRLFQNCQDYKEFKKGDKRVNYPRICSICGRPLSTLTKRTQKYILTQNQYRFELSALVSVHICKDINSCYRVLDRKGELADGNG
ncbi:hypothetical protein D307_gp2 [Bacillus phage Bastille]|uniref:Uncharacterized protein n=3 Tax=Bastillevirus TaxID=1918010 RepID=L7UXN6_9CAUD|nr:hypothetical protein D307_gp2 [Bacillus phage Bastille]YP_009035260.1 hypothetical protein FP73_gp063 [Bacillus phage Hoody T]ASU00915.1 hypothetical protein ANTHONY_68 [Bacillus phage Anthony]AZF89169.1 hypothetical protein Goe5_c00610 [Bacillus phage vB_BthM-Goe5]AGC55696.1 hypothetical protein [Bacillus phage Bastille]AHZ10375.1 hypothetical protein [Bacillus phage Hoody T]